MTSIGASGFFTMPNSWPNNNSVKKQHANNKIYLLPLLAKPNKPSVYLDTEKENSTLQKWLKYLTVICCCEVLWRCYINVQTHTYVIMHICTSVHSYTCTYVNRHKYTHSYIQVDEITNLGGWPNITEVNLIREDKYSTDPSTQSHWGKPLDTAR